MESTKYSPLSNEEYINVLKALIDAQGYAGECKFRLTTCGDCKFSEHFDDGYRLYRYKCKAFYMVIEDLKIEYDSLNYPNDSLKYFKDAYNIAVKRLIESEQ